MESNVFARFGDGSVTWMGRGSCGLRLACSPRMDLERPKRRKGFGLVRREVVGLASVVPESMELLGETSCFGGAPTGLRVMTRSDLESVFGESTGLADANGESAREHITKRGRSYHFSCSPTSNSDRTWRDDRCLQLLYHPAAGGRTRWIWKPCSWKRSPLCCWTSHENASPCRRTRRFLDVVAGMPGKSSWAR
jgi:hypothetical protein